MQTIFLNIFILLEMMTFSSVFKIAEQMLQFCYSTAKVLPILHNSSRTRRGEKRTATILTPASESTRAITMAICSHSIS